MSDTKPKAKKVTLNRLPKQQEKFTTTQVDDQEAVHVINEKRNIEVMFRWSSPARIWAPKTKIWYLNSAVLVMVIILFAVLSRYPGYPWLILMLMAFMLMWYLYGSIPPEIIDHKITTKGIYTYGVLYPWQDIQHFWISHKQEHSLLYLDFYPSLKRPRIGLLIAREDEDDIFDSLIDHTKYASPSDAQYNFVARPIYGIYQPISNYLPDLDK